jgi:hypothetical protein
MGVAVAVTAAGCTYAGPADPPDSHAATVPGASLPLARPTSTSVAVSWDAPLTGRFISQNARTVGVVRIERTVTGVALILDGVSTKPNPDLKVVLNEGALTKVTSGSMVVQDPKSVDIAARLKPGSRLQSFGLPPSPPFRIRSVTIMDWRTNIAYGTADLTPNPATK